MPRSLPAIVIALLVAAAPLRADAALDVAALNTTLDGLVTQGNTLIAKVQGTTLNPLTISSQLASLASSVASYSTAVNQAYATVASSVGAGNISLTSGVLVDLQTLATIQASLAAGVQGLAAVVVGTAPMTALTSLQSSLTSMLSLAADIGTMADRILEMADKILVMSDNIGSMADRILATQVIQNTNIALVVSATLQTQQNMLTLFGMYRL